VFLEERERCRQNFITSIFSTLDVHLTIYIENEIIMNTKTRKQAGDEMEGRMARDDERQTVHVSADINVGFMKTRLGSRIAPRPFTRMGSQAEADPVYDLTRFIFHRVFFTIVAVDRSQYEIGLSRLSLPAGSR